MHRTYVNDCDWNTNLFVKVLCLYFVLLPTSIMSMGSFGSVLKLVGVFPVLVYILGRIRPIRISKVFKAQLYFVLWACISIIWSINIDLSWSRIESQLLFLILITPLGAYSYNEQHIKWLKMSLVWSSRITVLIVLMYGTLSEGRLFLQGTLAEDPNLLCSYFLFGIVYSFMVLLGNGKIWEKMIAVLEIFIYAYTILATGSRGGLISVATAFLIVFVFYNGEYSKGVLFKKVIIAILILIGATMVVTLISDDMLKRYTIASVVASKGTHRLEFWERGMEIYADSNLFRQIFGYGYNTMRTIFSRNSFKSVVIHNVYLEYLMEIGTIGLMIYMNSLIKYIIAGIRKKDFFSLAVICGMMALAVSTNVIAFKPYWNIMIYTICSCTLYKEDVECNNELREMVE